METRGGQAGFGPVYAPGSKALILGTYPSPKSFEAGFYYGHARNRFWPLLAALAGRALPEDIPQKTALVLETGLALWDVLERCEITGAQDSSIRAAQPNDIAALVRQTQIEAVFCNGAAAHRLYSRHCQAATGLAAVRLPSTSPANAAFSFQRLLAAWQPLRAYMDL
ncbi:MAG: DNA-deoxyinosine glycosylase [Oscillospiraceae bacterium]|jgi:hypoxanthine-DNA glycosylase